MAVSMLLLIAVLAGPTPAAGPAQGWADPAMPYRVRITVSAQDAAEGRVCAAMPMDLASDLASLGLPSALDLASLRLVGPARDRGVGADIPCSIRDGSLVWPLPTAAADRVYYLYARPAAQGAPSAAAVRVPPLAVPDYATDTYGKGWDFDRGDFEAIDVWGDKPEYIRSRRVEDGVLKLDVSGDAYFIWGDMWGSPQRSQRPVSIDLRRYPVLEMRIRQSVPDADWALYGRPGRGESLLRHTFRVSGTGWQTVRIDLRRQARWHGVLTAFRIDPTKYADAHVEFDWVRLLALVEARRDAVEVLGHADGAASAAILLRDRRPMAGAEQDVLVRVLDGSGQGVPGQPVQLALAPGSGGAVRPAEGRPGLRTAAGMRAITDGRGEVAFRYRASAQAVPGADRLTAAVEFTSAPPARLALTPRPGPPARYVVTPDRPVVLRPGAAPVRITARLADALGNPLPGRRPLVWSAPGARLVRADSRTASDGRATAVLRGDPDRRWVVRVGVRDATGLAGRSAEICVLPQGPRAAPVRVGPNGYFQAGDKPWLPLGGFYANWVGAPSPDGEWRRLISFTDATDAQIVAWLRFLTRNGVTAQRFMLRTHRPDGMEPMDIGGRVNPGLFAAFLHYLDLARPFGLRFLVVLHEDYTKPVYFDGQALERYALPWYAGWRLDRLPPYQRRFIRDRRLIEDIADKYTDPDVIACQDRYAREVVGLLKGNPLVFGYELENEMVGCPASWVRHMDRVIRSVDPATPICVSHGGGGLFAADPAWWMASTDIDFYTPHLYPDGPVTSPECDYGLAVDVLMRYVRAGKPAFLGESSGDQFSAHPDREVRRWTMRDIIWLSLANGRPGCFFWNARGSEVAEFRLAHAIAGRIDWSRFRRKRPRTVVQVPHALTDDQWFRSGAGGAAYPQMARYARYFLGCGADFDFAATAAPRGAAVLDGTRFSPPAALPSDFAVSRGHQLAPLVREDSAEALLYVRCFAGVERWDSPGERPTTQYLRRRAAAPLTVTVRLPGRFTADVWDLDTGTHQRRAVEPGGTLDLGTTDHDFAIHLARQPARLRR